MTRRIFLYLFGVGLGIIVSFLFFGDRDIDFSYLPNARTVKHLRSQELRISEQAMCQLDCIGVSQLFFENLFNESDLEVDFSSSKVDGTCKNYHIKIDEARFSEFQIDDCDSLSYLTYLEVPNCDCR
ncbi:hypothetical protein N9V23_00265 [Flavobacteriales bacterium]|nr:hypothetical protein [Flavobacteriales bacterium]MDB2621904.1 hypothetical protein [Flavobacteriales bacterium]